MDADNKNTLPDVQSARDGRNIAIDRVGVRGITVPITVETKEDTLATVATVEMTVSLPADKKGTHMSRFVALMEEHSEPLNVDVVRSLMADMLKRLDAVDGTIELRFPFFIRKCAPVSKLTSLMNYEAAWIADSRGGVITVRHFAKETSPPRDEPLPLLQGNLPLRRSQPALPPDGLRRAFRSDEPRRADRL